MKFLKFFIILLFLVSCQSKTKYKKPDNLIPKKQMIDLLTDMHLAIGASSVNNIYSEKSKKYMFLVFEKYKIDSARFASSNIYYTSKVDEYKKMIEEVKNKLEKEREKYDIISDSINKPESDSIRKYSRKPKKKLKNGDLRF